LLPECAEIFRPYAAADQKIFDEFRSFVAVHGVARERVLQPVLWDMCTVAKVGAGTISLRSRVANQLKIIMDRFRRGYYVFVARAA
jgi:hypothetical protein